MVKKRIKKIKSGKNRSVAEREHGRRRKYYTTWHNRDGTSERLTVYSIPNGVHRELLEKYELLEKMQAVDLYVNKLESSKDVGEVDWYEHLLIQARADLQRVDNLLGEDICRIAVDKPLEWFDNLAPDEWAYLYTEVTGILHHIPIKHTYMLAHQRSVNWFQTRSGQAFTGEQVAKELERIAQSFLTGEKKKIALNTVS